VPQLVSLEVKRSAVLAWLRSLEDDGRDVAFTANLAHIHAFKKPIVSSR
jgi:hypothetical protein